MTQAERDRVKAYMRKLARIAQELNDLAFQMADFEGAEHKESTDPLLDETAPAESYAQHRTETLMDKASRWQAVLDDIEAQLQNPQLSQEKRAALLRQRNVYRGHITRYAAAKLRHKDEVVWKSQVK